MRCHRHGGLGGAGSHSTVSLEVGPKIRRHFNSWTTVQSLKQFLLEFVRNVCVSPDQSSHVVIQCGMPALGRARFGRGLDLIWKTNLNRRVANCTGIPVSCSSSFVNQSDRRVRSGVDMTYRGTVKKGVVVFKKKPPLKDGTPVRVEALTRPAQRRARRLSFDRVKPWVGPPGELDELLAEVQRMRDADMVAERDAWR
jgi:hypothetical protein